MMTTMATMTKKAQFQNDQSKENQSYGKEDQVCKIKINSLCALVDMFDYLYKYSGN